MLYDREQFWFVRKGLRHLVRQARNDFSRFPGTDIYPAIYLLCATRFRNCPVDILPLGSRECLRSARAADDDHSGSSSQGEAQG